MKLQPNEWRLIHNLVAEKLQHLRTSEFKDFVDITNLMKIKKYALVQCEGENGWPG
jgi:hypothetical protein